MNVLVTGGAGFIGANLCRALVAHPTIGSVRVLDDLSTGSAGNLDGLPVRLVEGSVLDWELVGSLVAEADRVVHLAARPSVPRSLADPWASHEVNADGTVRVLEAARRHGVPVVAASSSSVYGSVPALPKHEGLPTRPLSPYAASKVAAEAYVLAYREAFGLPTLALRFFNVYGPLQPADHAYAAVVPSFVRAALDERPLTIYGDGHQTRDFTYVGTVVNVLVEAVVGRVSCADPVNLAFGTRISLLELTRRLEAVLDLPVKVEHAAGRAGDVRHSQADDTLLRALFPRVAPVPLETGLAETVRWFRSLPGCAR